MNIRDWSKSGASTSHSISRETRVGASPKIACRRISRSASCFASFPAIVVKKWAASGVWCSERLSANSS